MQTFKYIAILCVSLVCFCFASTAKAASECCPAPPACTPTWACPIETAAGAVADGINEVVEWGSGVYKKVSQAVQFVQTKIAKVRRMALSAMQAVKDVIADVVAWPFKQLGNVLGLTKDVEDDKDSVTQDNRHGEDISVEDRMHANLQKYADESKADYASEFFTVEKRKFIRQQATITLMARMLVLKSHFKDMKKIVDEIDAKVEKVEANSSGGADGKMSGSKSEAQILRENQQLRLAWYKLLSYQRMIEAVKLEFAANQAIAGMKLVKKVPDIKSGGEGDASSGDK